MQAVPLTFRRAFDEYHLPALRATSATTPTLYTYRYAVKAWEKYGFPNLDVRELRQSHLLQLRANMLSIGMSPVSFDARWACLKGILATLIAEELVERIPATPRIKKTITDPKERPTPEQVVRLLEHCDAARWPLRCDWRRLPVSPGTFWRSIYAVAFITALRRSDLRRLRWEHCRYDGIRIEPQKTSRYRKEVFCPDVSGLLKSALRSMEGCHVNRVFPCGFRGDLVAEAQRSIAIAARVPAKLATFQAFRCASLDAWTEADERAPELISGHGIRMARITRSVYVGRDRQQSRAETILSEAVERFPVPDGFMEILIGKES